jgi:prophage tail gpP-like protein
MTIRPQEVATVVVDGRRFDDWESVMVQHRWAEAFPIFRFTAAERDPVARLWERLQFRPGDECAIYLGGQLAISGVILLRQASYDANSHGVMLQGVGTTWYAARGSIIDKTSNFDNHTFQQAAMKVIAPFGVGVKIIGALNATPFKRLQCEPGETLWNFLERIARPRGIVMGSDHRGNLLLIGDHAYTPTATLVEGDNILRCQATISREAMFSDYVVRGQTAADDSQHGKDASEQEALVKGIIKRYSPLLTPAEQPVWNLGEIADRAKNESVWHEGTEVRANITAQGWFNPDTNGLWRAGDQVTVNSPMAMLNGMALKIEAVTFTQEDKAGTLTSLELCAPWLLKDRGDFNVGRLKGLLDQPADPTTSQTPPATPQSSDVPAPPPDTLSSA